MEKAVTIRYDQPILRLYCVADAHVGAAACNEARIERLAGIIESDPYARVIGGGDLIEAIAPDDRRWDPRELAEPASPELLENLFYRQTLRFCKLMERTAGKWDGLILGNHEQTAVQKYYINPASIIAERMGTRYVGANEQCGWFRYVLEDKGKIRAQVRVFAIHGWGGGELRGGDALKLQRLLWKKGADIILLAHVHRPMVFPETVETVDRQGRIVTEERFGVINYPLVDRHGYLARRGGNSCPAGCAVIQIERLHDGCNISVELKSL
jgi:hypothetical protein